MKVRKSVSVLLLSSAILLAGCAGAPESKSSSATSAATSFKPFTLKNCGYDVEIKQVPKRAVALNQGTTELMLSLGLEKSMVGTSYLDDKEINPKFKKAYDTIKVLAKRYPTKEVFLATKPDFAYTAYLGTFKTEKGWGRDQLKDEGIATYISPLNCKGKKNSIKREELMKVVNGEIRDIGRIFAVPDRAEALIKEQEKQFESLKKENAGKGKRAIWLDGVKENKPPYVGGGQGGPQIIMDTVGLKNVFEQEKGGWFDGSWEKIIAADPDVLVLADASWDTAQAKIKYLESDPVTKNMKAVKNKAYVTIRFSESTPGVTLIEGAANINKQLSKLK